MTPTLARAQRGRPRSLRKISIAVLGDEGTAFVSLSMSGERVTDALALARLIGTALRGAGYSTSRIEDRSETSRFVASLPRSLRGR